MKGQIMIMGDLNARTGCLNDFIGDDDKQWGMNDDMRELYPNDYVINKRLNQDCIINNVGKTLINLCKTHQLRILNGRTIGDLKGNFTCVQPGGMSTNDYCVVSQDLVSNVKLFKVNYFNHISDHALIAVTVNIKTNTREFKKLHNTADKMTDGYK